MSFNPDENRALAAALHDQRGYLGNIVVAMSLMKRKSGVSSDPSALEVIGRVERATDGILRICKLLQLLVEIEDNRDLLRTESSLGSILGPASDESSGGDYPTVRTMGGDDSISVGISKQAGISLVSAFFDAARALTGPSQPATILVTERDGGCELVADISAPVFEVQDTHDLFDGSWHSVGKPGIRGVALGMYVARRAAEACGGKLEARLSGGGGVELILWIPGPPLT